VAGTRDSAKERTSKGRGRWISAAALVIAALITGLFTYLARQTSDSTTSATTAATTRDVLPEGEITSPRAGDSVPMVIEVRGHASNVPKGDELWIFVKTELPAVRYHPQTAATSVQPGGRWTSPEVFVGLPEDAGRNYHFDIVAVLADSTAQESVGTYLDGSARAGNYPGFPTLPRHAVELDRIRVARQ
jgi:hypothetical protein